MSDNKFDTNQPQLCYYVASQNSHPILLTKLFGPDVENEIRVARNTFFE